MKKNYFLFFTLALFGLSINANAQTITSIANGNWTSPTTWGGTPPMPGSTVVINNSVTLDMDYGYSTGSITINASGSLTGNSAMRAFALSGGTLTVNGTLHIARTALYSGTVNNNGTFQNDSLLDAMVFTNNTGGIINAGQFMVNTGGTFNNNGAVVSTNFLNISAVTNNGTITATDFMNSKSFTNAAAGVITTNDFLNSDSLASPAVFTNNGRVIVNHDWRNTNQVNGSGKFCIQDNTENSGAMTGTFDFCDLTGGNIDLNTGTIANTITHCLFSCATGINESAGDLFINLCPNPSNGIFSVNYKNISGKNVIEIYNLLGEKVYLNDMITDNTKIDLSIEAKGIYFYQIKNENKIINTGKVIIE